MIVGTVKIAFLLNQPRTVTVHHPGRQKLREYYYPSGLLDINPPLSNVVPAFQRDQPTTQTGPVTVSSSHAVNRNNRHTGRYTITDLGTLGGASSEANAVNNHGQ